MIGIVSTIGIMVLDDFSAGVQDLENFNDTHVENTKTSIITFNEGSVFIFFGLVAAAIVSSYLLRQHPVYAIFSIILLYISAYIVATISNFFQDFTTDPQTVAAANNFPLLLTLMENIVPITFGAGIIIIIAMFAKTGGGEQQI